MNIVNLFNVDILYILCHSAVSFSIDSNHDSERWLLCLILSDSKTDSLQKCTN